MSTYSEKEAIQFHLASVGDVYKQIGRGYPELSKMILVLKIVESPVKPRLIVVKKILQEDGSIAERNLLLRKDVWEKVLQ